MPPPYSDVRLTRRAVAAGLSVFGAAPAHAREYARSAKSAVVRLGVVDVPFHAVAGAVVLHTLTRALVDVRVVSGDHAALFSALKSGEIDLLAVAWLPDTHAHLMQGLDGVTAAATLYRGAHIYWAMPKQAARAGVVSIRDLARPGVADRVEKRIVSIGPSAGLTIRSQRAVEQYGLDQLGFVVEATDAATWAAHIEERAKSGAWFCAPLWRPHHLSRLLPLSALRDPFGVLGGRDQGVLLARQSWLTEADPELVAELAALDIGLGAIERMDLAVAAGATPDQAAAAWMARSFVGMR